ncbi:hypothetical protein [Mycobacteroides abscessus]|uniref:hypothetical protein n=1 Tax=Mycobacteroides abscessus TaxID=36809 RepID=UPI0013FD054C|nr:hypothetical protein [Mycobacteroides abscessus]MDB2217393.1 hypothetical protein [Mycobacteroides abscessus subsp. massiliense]MDB2229981.1 hypothetical protein [Mycobacteroides abscessus subsp. abscessus]
MDESAAEHISVATHHLACHPPLRFTDSGKGVESTKNTPNCPFIAMNAAKAIVLPQ